MADHPAIQLVIFDCDGVLIDSETLSNRIVAEEVTKLGLPMTHAESMATFVGYTLEDMPAVIEPRLGRAIPRGWVGQVRQALIAAFGDVRTIAGAEAALHAVAAIPLPFRVASNSSHEEMAAKFAATGLAPLFDGRRHSALDVPRGKPSPDVFLAAAAAEGVPPAACLVVEDSLPGVRAAVAAGMQAVGLAPGTDGSCLRAAGADIIHGLDELAPLVRRRSRLAA